jgi:hypothetical protein
LTFEEFASSQQVADTARALSRAVVAGQAQDLLNLSQMYFEAPEEAGVELSRELIDRAAWQSAVLGAGIVLGPEGEVPVAVISERLVEREGWTPEGKSLFDRLYPLQELEAGRAFLDRWGEGISPQMNLAALILPEPEPQFRPGDRVVQGARFGTVGCRVTSEDGRPAVLTAGHVVTGVGALVRASGAIGTVTYCSDPARVPPAAAVADVAVIVPNGPRPLPPGGLQVSRAAPAAAGDLFTSYGVISGPQPMECAAFIDPLHVRSMAGRWASVYMTTEGLTEPGDSGGMVLSPEGDLVGHVVGGSGHFVSWIQDANYQLAQSRARL